MIRATLLSILILGCASNITEADQDVLDCRASSEMICGSYNTYNYQCYTMAFRQCLRWKGYSKKGDMIRKPGSRCDSAK